MTATAEHKFSIADRVIHPGKPEWGVGTVATTSSIVHEGTPCQRLAIRFDRAGLKTITTAFVALQQATKSASIASDAENPLPAAASDDAVPQDAMAARRLMSSLPDAATDPFASPASRLRAIVNLYRFEPTGGSLIDWAAAQSKLADPLSRFNRHELEEFFSDFKRALDSALRKSVREATKVDPAELRDIASKAPPAGQRALQEMHRRR